MFKLIIFTILVSSCAQTIVDPNSKKAFRNKFNNDIVWNQKIFAPGLFMPTYEVDKIFIDDKIAQEDFQKAQKSLQAGGLWTWGSIFVGVSYLYTTPRDKDRRNQVNLSYLAILLTGAIVSNHYRGRGEDEIDRAIEDYNLRKSYALAPVVYRPWGKSIMGLGIRGSF